MEALNLLLLLNERISPKFLKKFPEYVIMSQKSSKMTQKSNSPFPSVSAAGLLGMNLVTLQMFRCQHSKRMLYAGLFICGAVLQASLWVFTLCALIMLMLWVIAFHCMICYSSQLRKYSNLLLLNHTAVWFHHLMVCSTVLDITVRHFGLWKWQTHAHDKAKKWISPSELSSVLRAFYTPAGLQRPSQRQRRQTTFT